MLGRRPCPVGSGRLTPTPSTKYSSLRAVLSHAAIRAAARLHRKITRPRVDIQLAVFRIRRCDFDLMILAVLGAGESKRVLTANVACNPLADFGGIGKRGGNERFPSR